MATVGRSLSIYYIRGGSTYGGMEVEANSGEEEGKASLEPVVRREIPPLAAPRKGNFFSPISTRFLELSRPFLQAPVGRMPRRRRNSCANGKIPL